MSKFVVQIYKNSNSNRVPSIRFPQNFPSADLTNSQLLQTAKELFQHSGVLTLHDLFSKQLISNLYHFFIKHYQAYFLDQVYTNVLDVGDKRKMLTVNIQDEFNNPELYGNLFLLYLIRQLLGPNFVLGSFGAVIALPGAKEQHIHRDHPPLFEEESLDLLLPSFAITVVIPLINLTPDTGSTQVWKGSHKVSSSQEFLRRDAFVPYLETGSCYLMDYQLLHGGTANTSNIVRPILYLIYYRSWFRESVNYDKQARLSLRQVDYDRVPAIYKFLFDRAKDSLISIGSSQVPAEQQPTPKFNDRSSSQQAHILEGLVKDILGQYGLEKTKVELISHGDNTVFAITDLGAALTTRWSSSNPDTSPYWPDRFILKVHRSHYLSATAIESELTWLQQLRQELGLLVPEPIPTLDGNLCVVIDSFNLDEARVCSLTRWIKGRSLSEKLRADQLTVENIKEIGQLMGTLHHYAAQQSFSEKFIRPNWNWDGLFGSSAGYSNNGDRVWNLVPRPYQKLFTMVSQEVQSVMAALGQSSEQYGLIHGDFWIGNLLHDKHSICPIDFTDCGFGYWGYEVARFLSDFLSHPHFSSYFNHLLDGYTQIRPFPDTQLSHLQLFVAAHHVSLALWCLNRAQNHPQFRPMLLDDLKETAYIVETVLHRSI